LRITRGPFPRQKSYFMRMRANVWPLLLLAGLLSFPRSVVREGTGLAALPVETDNYQGIRTNGNYTVEQLVGDIFVKGGCRNISNIRAIGDKRGLGFFEAGHEVIGIDKGIILATGHIGNAHGPNTATDKSGDFNDAAGDRDLRRLASDRIYDVVGFEFDFVPLDSIVTFRYVFASEEYCEYADSKFNDVFGFFISGPGIEGEFSDKAINVALLPSNRREYVSINNVNHKRNAQYYIPNELESDARSCNKPFQNSPLLSLIEYDGFTTVLTAELKLIPCEKYHLRLVVGDVNDRLYDSAVFLEAESFNIGGEVTIASQVTIDAPAAIEGCPSGQFVFERVDKEDVSKEVEVRFKLDPESTATPGEDFAPLPSSVIIPAGAMRATLPVEIYNDQRQEPIETIILELDYPCDCVTGKATLYISDPPELRVVAEDQNICPGGTATLRAEAFGGTPPFQYRWSTGDSGPSTTVRPESAAAYTVTVVDDCQQEATRRVRVDFIEPARAEISGEETVCPGQEATLRVRFNGLPPWSFSYAVDGKNEKSFSGVTQNPFSLRVRDAGVYRLTAFSDARCVGLTTGRAEVKVAELRITVEAKGVSCAGNRDGQVDVLVSGGQMPYQYAWDNGQGARKNLQNVAPGRYNLSVTDANDCMESLSVVVPEPPPLQPLAFDCLDLGTDSLMFFSEGGTPPYRYSVDGINYFPASRISEQLEEGEWYNLITLDANGCRHEQDFVMPANTADMVRLPSEITVILGEKYVMDPLLNMPQTLIERIDWSPNIDITCTNCLRPAIVPKENRTYKIRLTDRFGCWDEASVIVNVNRQPSVYIPTAFSPNNDGHNDRFMIFANPSQVNQVRLLQVYSRWGALLFEARNVPPNHPDYGWDGRFRGQFQRPGLYVYRAEIELVNGRVIVRTGDVALVR
jgi:gliding motility-associated-like protein